MNALNFGMIHSCSVLNTTQDQRLNFTNGSKVFTVGRVLTGSTSHAHGTVKTLVLSSGSWTSGDAVGYIILSTVTGAFVVETITDNGIISGSATGQGPIIPETNDVGTPAMTTVTTAYDKCRFENIRNPGGYLYNSDTGEYTVTEPIVFLPADAVVLQGDLISGNESPYNTNYKVTFVNPLYSFFNKFVIDHIEASLKVVEKRQTESL
jgi:hypothetical protein